MDGVPIDGRSFQPAFIANVTANYSTINPIGADSLGTTVASLWTFLLSLSAIRDGAKLFVLGGALESTRRLLSLAWTSVAESFFITAEFEEKDDTFSMFLASLP